MKTGMIRLKKPQVANYKWVYLMRTCEYSKNVTKLWASGKHNFILTLREFKFSMNLLPVPLGWNLDQHTRIVASIQNASSCIALLETKCTNLFRFSTKQIVVHQV